MEERRHFSGRSRGRRGRSSSHRVWALGCLVGAIVLVSACATARGGPEPAADVAGTFDVGGGRMMYMECHGTGSPTIVLVSGQRASADDWSITADGVNSPAVFSRVSEDTRVCAYDRPGTPAGG